MSGFQTQIDIGNRACQHCGVPRIAAALLFTEEDSKAAREIGFVYDKLRRAELQRNFWTFSIKKAALRPIDTTTMLLAPSLWDLSATYFVGSIAADANGLPWISVVPDNTGNEPVSTAAWVPYFGPLTVGAYDATQAYFAGELVYTAAGDGTNRVYLSLQSGNSDDPAVGAAWDATATYSKDQVVTYASVGYMSLIDLNENNVPSAAPLLWSVGTTYGIGAQVGASDGLIYQSVATGNTGNDPVADAGAHWVATGAFNPWTRVFVHGAGSPKWLQIGGAEFPSGVTLTTLTPLYPLGAGPASQSASLNAYRLPAGFLRKAPQDPKAGSSSVLGAPTNALYDDWLIESGYIVTRESNPIILRFVADVADVRLMHDMFCEGLGARIGFEVCEALTQSVPKRSTIAQTYQKMMGEARLVDAIEEGATEAPLDDFIACRA